VAAASLSADRIRPGPAWRLVLRLCLALAVQPGAAFAAAAATEGAGTPAVAGGNSNGAVVFMYHRFGEAGYPATNVTREAFAAQLELLREASMNVIPLSRLLAYLAGEDMLPERAVVLTIDDAYASIATVAWPLLREAGYPVTVFVATDPVDKGFSDYLDWDAIRSLAGQGVSFANHGAAHLHLADPLPEESAAERRERVREDLWTGQRRLAAMVPEGAIVADVFAYPFGEYDELVAELVEALGWVAFGQHSGAVGAYSDRRALPRFPINEAYSGLDSFRTKALSLPLPVTRVNPFDPVVGAMPTLELTLAEGFAGSNALQCFVSGQDPLRPTLLAGGQRLAITPSEPLPPGRSRVNCTAPGPEGRFYWFSHQWLVR